VLVETERGPRLVKLRGAAQGTGPLVAEVIVAVLAEALALKVPERSRVVLGATLPVDGGDDELSDLLRASVGVNLGFALLAGAREPTGAELVRIDRGEAATILWLDRLVLNPDRTARNPNLLLEDGSPWLIDHGASLGFHYAWARVTEAAPREPGTWREPHLLAARAGDDDWLERDARLAARLTRDVLERAVGDVPDEFLSPLLPRTADPADALRRRRAAYAAFLWKRLKAPRAFATEPARIEAPALPRGRPEWLR
jgi:hypothetical protein